MTNFNVPSLGWVNEEILRRGSFIIQTSDERIEEFRRSYIGVDLGVDLGVVEPVVFRRRYPELIIHPPTSDIKEKIISSIEELEKTVKNLDTDKCIGCRKEGISGVCQRCKNILTR